MSDISFEYNVPVFAGAPDEGTEPTHRDTPQYEALDWVTTKMGVQKAEELGFDAVWAPDHLLLGRDHAEYECWTLLSAIAGFTEDINLGSLVLCNDYRNPALVAKMAATLDVISDGRLELGLGAGWHEPEYDAYGWEYRDGFERLMRLDESIRLMKRMWAAGTDGASFDGKHYQIEDAYCVPGPVQDPHPPILVGGQGEEVTLKLVAKHADVWNTDVFNGDVETLEHKIGVIEDHCDTVGRDPDDIEYSWDGHVICTRDEEKFDRLLDLMTPIQFEAEYQDQAPIVTEEDAREYFIMGTPEECAEAIERRIDAGVTKFQGWFIDFPDTGGMELFADEVIPQFS
ncbi:TIGR03560 family F420-dependent LLM class oxidoreductase [Haloferax volcanii]|uniref:Luciferase-like monooxygenase superfamily protein n=3 Tax=Haloferax volcanii TaxID=2246 RepID=A0A384L2B8_HALVD|nr:TIGR03560 family F420-dependent LLM class oxidoreductase [Haloferax volcanii]ADE01398.1 putative F420-dependent oxidoreductase [Haloferax volcanii DS2]ELY36720.1 Luciferase-like monooxygenase superfamily protein [Haloferax volcanii DS2]MBS8118194.1 TIGR03560 family F420-dependent LLM class oxidoreductase [Haloferax volcanii]MBS8123206.1 TIGR03560 family F420-dependent LLM class oxidoreductase [Haloferax volcanii]MBS8127074.1 TIGR03560 family F420-dependent LLM class oxidoreductase [Halofera